MPLRPKVLLAKAFMGKAAAFVAEVDFHLLLKKCISQLQDFLVLVVLIQVYFNEICDQVTNLH